YVFSFYCSEMTNETSKYVPHTTLTWHSTTLLEKGVVCTENDETIGAYLEIVTYNFTKSGTISGKGATNLWAENGSHDNLNESGYVSLDNDVTTPPEECGLFMTIPLQIDLPTDFDLTFGMGAGSQALKNWTISYSIDKETWYEGNSFIIDHKISSGSYYLYFTLPIHLEIPIPARSTLYLKFTPNGSVGVDSDDTDGTGTSAYIRFHSCVIISEQVEGSTSTPSGAVYFEPFDKLTAGVDYFIGEKAAALANFCSSGIEDWDSDKLNGLTGSYVYERPGYAQIGYMDTERVSSRTTASAYTPYSGELVTPAIGRSGDFTLSFKAAAYRSPAIRDGSSTGVLDVKSPDLTSVIVEIVGDGTVEGSTSYTVTSVPTDAFKTFTLSLKGITADTKISFKSAGDGVPSRWFIDDILITE
ncbi:MAG: hypothetical protein LUE27_04145, partial [Clostridia bacterium]|nr:hypothetical protein [Clostridia bacterium]